MTPDTEDVVARQFERLIAVEKALANGSHFADDPECHPLYPQAVAARQTLQEHVQSLSDRIDGLEADEPSEAMICAGGSAVLKSAHLTGCERAKLVYAAMRAALHQEGIAP